MRALDSGLEPAAIQASDYAIFLRCEGLAFFGVALFLPDCGRGSAARRTSTCPRPRIFPWHNTDTIGSSRAPKRLNVLMVFSFGVGILVLRSSGKEAPLLNRGPIADRTLAHDARPLRPTRPGHLQHRIDLEPFTSKRELDHLAYCNMDGMHARQTDACGAKLDVERLDVPRIHSIDRQLTAARRDVRPKQASILRKRSGSRRATCGRTTAEPSTPSDHPHAVGRSRYGFGTGPSEKYGVTTVVGCRRPLNKNPQNLRDSAGFVLSG